MKVRAVDPHIPNPVLSRENHVRADVHGLRELEQTILSEAVILLGEAVCPGVSKQCSHAEVEVCRPELSREQGSSLQQVRGGD